jgi:hypothetical protein
MTENALEKRMDRVKTNVESRLVYGKLMLYSLTQRFSIGGTN